MKYQSILCCLFFYLTLSPLASFAYTVVVNVQELLESLPSYNTTQNKIKAMEKEYQYKIDSMQKKVMKRNINNSYFYYSLGLVDEETLDTQSTTENDSRLVDEQISSMRYEMEERKKIWLQPLLDTVTSVVERVANEKKYSLVFNYNIFHTPILFFTATIDKTNEIKEEIKKQCKLKK